jgi:hypothetical protein
MLDERMIASCSACAKEMGEAQLDIALWSGVRDGTKEYAYLTKLCSMCPVHLDPMCC